MTKRDELLQAAANEHAVIKNHPGGRTIDVARNNAFIAGANWQREFAASFGRELQHYKPDDRPSFGVKKNRKSLPDVNLLSTIIAGCLIEPPFKFEKRGERWFILRVDNSPIGLHIIPPETEYAYVYNDEIDARLALKILTGDFIAKKILEAK